MAVATNVTDHDAVDALARTAIDTYGKLSIWVNNAGGSPARMPLTELSRQQCDDCIELDKTAVWVGITTAARYMQTGSIINISSGAGTGPVPGAAVLLLCSPAASWITGETLRVGGGAKPR